MASMPTAVVNIVVTWMTRAQRIAVALHENRAIRSDERATRYLMREIDDAKRAPGHSLLRYDTEGLLEGRSYTLAGRSE